MTLFTFGKRKPRSITEVFYRCCQFLPMESIEEWECGRCGCVDYWRKTRENIGREIMATFACPRCRAEKQIRFARPLFLVPQKWRFWRRIGGSADK